MENSVYLRKHFFSTLDGNENKLLKRIIFLVPLVSIVCLISIKFIVWPKLYFWLVREDGVVEYATFLSYFASFIFALAIAFRFCKKKHTLYSLFYFVFCAGAFYIAMEEISWGQRFFNVKTPEVFNIYNYQKEMNTHNFLTRHCLHGLYILVGFYGAFVRLVLPKKIKTKYSSELGFLVPDAYLFFYFLPVFTFYFYWDYLSIIEPYLFGNHYIRDHFVHGKDQEPVELLLSFGFLLFVLINKYRQNAGNHLHFQYIKG